MQHSHIGVLMTLKCDCWCLLGMLIVSAFLALASRQFSILSRRLILRCEETLERPFTCKAVMLVLQMERGTSFCWGH